jgi:hypothetical protein
VTNLSIVDKAGRINPYTHSLAKNINWQFFLVEF